MDITFLVWVAVAMVLLALTAGLSIGYYCGREDTEDPDTWTRAPEPIDAGDWAAALAAPDAGEPAGGRLASTGELEQMAFEGDTEGLVSEIAAFQAARQLAEWSAR